MYSVAKQNGHGLVDREGRQSYAAGERLSSGEGWRQELPLWLNYLIAAYPQARVDMMTYAVLEDVFQEVEAEVMRAAVRSYVGRHKFWPTAADLRPYVEWAEREAAPKPTLEELRRMHEAKMARIRASIQYTDEEILAWERARGSLPPEGWEGDWPVEDAGAFGWWKAQEERAEEGAGPEREQMSTRGFQSESNDNPAP